MALRVTWKLVDALLGVAIRVLDWRDQRNAKKRARASEGPQGLTFKDVQHQQAQMRSAATRLIKRP